MFLATTALSEFWDRDDEILFLGAWCLRRDRQSEWADLRFRVLPSPWADRERFHADAERVSALYEDVLAEVADFLNHVHDVRHPRRYWRILVGPWLLRYLHPAYDRYVHLLRAQQHCGLRTVVLDPACYQIPRDTYQFTMGIIDDPFNFQLCSQLISELDFDVIERRRGAVAATDVKRATPLRARLVSWGRRAAATLPQFGPTDVEFHDLNTSTWTKLRLARRFGAGAVLANARLSGLHLPDAPLQSDLRQRLGQWLAGACRHAPAALLTPISALMPSIYLEGYCSAREAVLSAQPKIPRVLVTAAGLFFSEPLKFLAAEGCARGGRLVDLQHGGGYGMMRRIVIEEHEARVADRMLVWGWAESANGMTGNLPSPRLGPIKRRRASRTGTVLFLSNAHPRYLHWFQSTPMGAQWDEYFEWQARFLVALPKAVRSVVRFRPYSTDYGFAIRQRLSERVPDVRWDSGRPIRAAFRRSRLIVVDHPSTGVLEALAANLPTIAFWDPRRWEVRATASADLAELVRAGILHERPEPAADLLARVVEDPTDWWSSAAVQGARDAFVRRHALWADDWLAQWTAAFRRELNLTAGPPHARDFDRSDRAH
jgi:hypothetical protein